MSQSPNTELATLSPPRIPFHPKFQEIFGVDRPQWKALVEAIFPNAQSADSVALALSYCKARNLDPFKRNVHIVPIWNKDLGKLVDTVWPGIGELRTTAFRTGQYAGRDEAEFGEDVSESFGGRHEYTFPAWCRVTVYRMLLGSKVRFVGPKVWWRETYATMKRDTDIPNEMWGTRPYGQIEKCAEAAALRAAFPEEIGSEYIPEEVEHAAPRVVQNTATTSKSKAEGTQADIDELRAKQAAAQQPNPVGGVAKVDAPSEPVVAEKGNQEGGDTGNAAEPKTAAQIEKERRQALPISHPDALPPDSKPWN